MCGRTTLTTGRDALAELLRVDEVKIDELPLQLNVAPTQLVYGAVGLRDGRRELRSFRWRPTPLPSRPLGQVVSLGVVVRHGAGAQPGPPRYRA